MLRNTTLLKYNYIEETGSKLSLELNKRTITTLNMTFNYIGLVILIIGALFFAMSITQPDNFIIYKMLKARSAMCCGEENASKVIMTYSLMMIIFGLLLMLRVFGKQEIDKED